MVASSPPAPSRAPERTLDDGCMLRPLAERSELLACVELQYRIWGEGFADVASPAVLKISQELGGVAAGAFAPGGELLGFVFGITGVRGGRPLHWSHMLAVLPEARGRDLGFHLKAYQRSLLLPLGVERVEWTYDPLVAKNAYLNLERLGARPVRYLRDFYGTGDDSALSAGIGTDRFVVAWPIADERVARAIAGDPARERAGEAGPAERVEVPPDIHRVRAESPERAARWRASTRAAFEELLGRGYEVVGFERTPAGGADAEHRCFYLLRERPNR